MLKGFPCETGSQATKYCHGRLLGQHCQARLFLGFHCRATTRARSSSSVYPLFARPLGQDLWVFAATLRRTSVNALGLKGKNQTGVIYSLQKAVGAARRHVQYCSIMFMLSCVVNAFGLADSRTLLSFDTVALRCHPIGVSICWAYNAKEAHKSKSTWQSTAFVEQVTELIARETWLWGKASLVRTDMR